MPHTVRHPGPLGEARDRLVPGSRVVPGCVRNNEAWRSYRAGPRHKAGLTEHEGHAQRASRSGAAPVRVFHTPSGDLYFSPALVCATRLQPLVNASCSTVAPLAAAF